MSRVQDGPVMLSAKTYDRFHDGYVALIEALTEARAYVWNVANDDDGREAQFWRREAAHEFLGRIDRALAMKANLK